LVLSTHVRSHQVTDLVIEVLDLSFAQGKELEANANLSLVVVLGLEFVCLSLPECQSGLELVDGGRLQVRSLELVLDVGSVLESLLQGSLDLRAERQVLWVEGLWRESVGNVLSQFVLHFVVALSEGLVLEIRSQVSEVVVALGLNLGRSVRLGKLAGKIVTQLLLLLELVLADGHHGSKGCVLILGSGE
jgi:hypothetical protein